MAAIHPALAIFPGSSPENAFEQIKAAGSDGAFTYDFSQAQITPQNFKKWSPENTEKFKILYPDTAFRFHASVRLEEYDGPLPWFDISRFIKNPNLGIQYFKALARCNAVLGNPTYSLHTGFRPKRDDIRTLINAYKRIEDIMQCTIAVETLYPHPIEPDKWWINSWKEHEALLNSGINFVIDFSHLNIIHQTEGPNISLVEAMLASEHLTEIHLSGNNGSADSHESLKSIPNTIWWQGLLNNSNTQTDIFSEGTIKE